MLQDIDGRAIAALPGLDPELVHDIVFHLNRDLATLTDVASSYKQAHWNVLGPGFAQLHVLFDEFADETRAYADRVAERAVSLGGTAHGTLQAAAECSILTPFPVNERDERHLLQALSQRLERTSEELRDAIGSSTEDPVTQDLYIEIARGIEKQRWMLLAHLWEPTSTRTGV